MLNESGLVLFWEIDISQTYPVSFDVFEYLLKCPRWLSQWGNTLQKGLTDLDVPQNFK